MSNSGLVLVTGAGGWVASHVVKELLKNGYKVRGTVRRLGDEKYSFLHKLPGAADNLELVEADLLVAEGWTRALNDVETVLHIASPFTISFKNESEVIRPAVEGVENCFKAALSSSTRVKRIIQTSSVCAVVYGHPLERYETKKRFDEDEWSVVVKISGYEKSKTLAEKRARDLISEHNKTNENKIEFLSLLPGFVFGPLLDKHHGTGESSNQIYRVMQKTYPFVPQMDASHVDVRDVALAHVKAVTLPSETVALHDRFLLAADDGDLTFQEEAKILSTTFKQYGFNPATTIAPKLLVTIGKYFMPNVRIAADKAHCVTFVSNARATEFLGIKNWRSAKKALEAHALSMMKFGIIPKRNTPDEILNRDEEE